MNFLRLNARTSFTQDTTADFAAQFWMICILCEHSHSRKSKHPILRILCELGLRNEEAVPVVVPQKDVVDVVR